MCDLSIREPFAAPDSPSPVRIGFITYDHQVHFYNLSHIEYNSEASIQNSSTSDHNISSSIRFGRPQMHIISDIEDVFVPAVEGFLIPPDPNAITCILEVIMSEFCSDLNQNSNVVGKFNSRSAPTDAILGPAIQAGLSALSSANRSGKLFVMHSNLPSAEGPGKLKSREIGSVSGTDKEKVF